MAFDDDILPPSARVQTWPEALMDFIEERRAAPLVWGENDCCAFAAEWVRRATGRDVFAPWAGYHTALAAARKVADAGGLEAIWTGILGAPIAAPFAKRGDVVLVLLEDRLSAAVCIGAQAAGPGEAGLVFVGMSTAQCAWAV